MIKQSAWTTAMSVGNAFLDDEHKKLLGMIDDVERAIRTKDSAALLLSIKTFEDTVRIHFVNEAKIAIAIDHPFDQHRLEHQYVLSELQKMKEDLLGTSDRWSESASMHYLFFLSNWASDHISEDDMLMKPNLLSRPYDFRPDDLTEA